MLAAAPFDVVVFGPAVAAAVEAVLFVAADQAGVGRTSDVAQAAKPAAAVVSEFAEAVVAVAVVSWPEDPLLVVVCKSEVAPLAVVGT